MNAIPRAIWGLIGLAGLVLMALVFLHFHDADVRKTAELTVVLDAKDDTIAQLNRDIAALARDVQAADAALATATGTVVRVAVVPQRVRDSIAVLTRALAVYQARGDSVVPTTLATGLQGQLVACRRQVDTIAAAVSGMATACARSVATRDSIIAKQRDLARQLVDQLAATQKLAGLSHPRLTPYVQANYSPVRHALDGEAGATLRLFAQLNLTGALRVGELSTDSLFRPDSLPRVVHHRADATIGLRYEFR